VKSKGTKDRKHKLRNEEKIEVLTTGYIQAASKPKKTGKEQEEAPMMLKGANETQTATTTTSSTAKFQAINTRDLRKSQCIETTKGSFTDCNAANVIEVPHPKQSSLRRKENRLLGLYWPTLETGLLYWAIYKPPPNPRRLVRSRKKLL